ncbi:extensin family protein [Rhizobiaceae bacterium BDR2-2]|uniref:Extensin family protein n=1 Tax=Ectorhizobium quercum TaxID=2965071 RepID=A0AAE3N508_9HYPH|nr:extensin family protein [Ectorhizobium quercum]MCX8999809.1 extensin family protein [Ectorhizobium quercum]
MAYCFSPWRFAAALTLSTALSACSTDALIPPGTIDGSTRVGAIAPPAQPQPGAPQPAATIPVEPAAESYGAPNGLHSASVPPASPEDGINMDEGLGVAGASSGGDPVVGLAEEQAAGIAEGNTSQPVVDGIGTDTPVLVRQPVQPMPPAPQSVPVESEGRQVAMLRPGNPVMRDVPSSGGTADVMPAAEQSCRAQLRRIGVTFRDIPRIDQGGSCRVDYPIKITGLPGGIGVNETTLNCQVALAFAQWVKGEVNPSARARYLSGVAKIQTMGGYSCRRMNSRSSNPWSEHARGNAIDIGKIVLKNGKEIDVRKKGFFAFREKGLLKTVRSDSCRYFSTVLGPGSDPDHWNHFHFDLRTRKSGYRHCN